MAACYDVRMNTRACKGKDCTNVLQRNNRSGYCTRNPECARVRSRARYEKKTPEAWGSCRNCGRPVTRSRKYEYCDKSECREIARRASARESYRKNYEYSLWNGARQRARAKDTEFTITRQDVRAAWTGRCPVFGYELTGNHTGDRAHARESFSLDRIDNTKGYIPGNIQILSYRANQVKSDLSAQELLQLAAWIQATYGEGDSK